MSDANMESRLLFFFCRALEVKACVCCSSAAARRCDPALFLPWIRVRAPARCCDSGGDKVDHHCRVSHEGHRESHLIHGILFGVQSRLFGRCSNIIREIDTKLVKKRDIIIDGAVSQHW